MDFLLVLAGATAFCLLCKTPIRTAPALFYVLAVVLSLLYAIMSYMTLPFWLQQLLFLLMQKGTLAMALFVVVMYMGIFKDVGFVKHRLLPTRATLSIIACLLVLGHVTKYLIAYLERFGVLPVATQGGLVVAMACFLLMLVLGVTSFQAVKCRMSAAAWVKLQKWAYLFYALVYVHIVLLLLPSVLGSGAAGGAVVASGAAGRAAATSLVVYTAIMVPYAVLRIGKALRDKRKASRAA